MLTVMFYTYFSSGKEIAQPIPNLKVKKPNTQIGKAGKQSIKNTKAKTTKKTSVKSTKRESTKEKKCRLI